KLLTTVAISIGLLTASQAMEKPSFHTKGTPTGKPTGALKPGEYWWHPEISPQGPFMILVSVPEQTMHVYRNGVLIGRSTVSTGSKAHATPGGVFSILEKKQTHRSKTYNDAPMTSCMYIAMATQLDAARFKSVVVVVSATTSSRYSKAALVNRVSSRPDARQANGCV